MPTKVLFNPSTLKVLYNPIRKKVLTVVTLPPASGSYAVNFFGVQECDCGACNWPSDLNSLDITLPYVRDNVCMGTSRRFWENTVDGWFITVYCYLDSVFKGMLCTAAYFDDENCGTHNRGMAFLNPYGFSCPHPNLLGSGACCVNASGAYRSDCIVPGVLNMGYDGFAKTKYVP